MTSSITAQTALCGILLHPAGHTRSPALHNAAFLALGIDARYLAFDVPPDALGSAIEGARALGLKQLAISIPHKVTVMEFLDEISPMARRIGAVNTVTSREGRLIGSNTDWIGGVRALERETALTGKHAIVIGAGGAARAVVFGLLEAGAKVQIANRTVGRAHALADELGAQAAGSLEEMDLDACEILVNTTSVGLMEDASPVDAARLRKGMVVLDAVYDPTDTRLLREARAARARPIEGKWMLIYQAAEQIREWTGQDTPIDVLEHAFDAAGQV